MLKNCEMCGKPLGDVSRNQKYCAECARKRVNNYHNAYFKQKRAEAQNPRICQYCGYPITAAVGNQKYHHECAGPAHYQQREAKRKENIKIKPRKTCVICGNPIDGNGSKFCTNCSNAINKKPVPNGARKKKPKKRKTPLRHCWDLDCKSALQIEIEARALGLTYGKYVSLIDTLMIERCLRDNGITNGLERIDKAWINFKRERAEREAEAKQRRKEYAEGEINGMCQL